jgi:hypothetical protein
MALDAGRPAATTIVLAVVVAIALTGCRVAAMSIKTQPPGTINSVAPQDFKAIKENEAARRLGGAYVGCVLTMKAGNQQVVAGQPFTVFPYASGFWSDMQTLLRWWGSYDYSPEGIAKKRDSGQHMKDVISTYRSQMNAMGVAHLERIAQASVDGSIVLTGLPVGDYIVTSEWRGYRGQMAVWAVKFRVEPDQVTQVMLTTSNAVVSY